MAARGLRDRIPPAVWAASAADRAAGLAAAVRAVVLAVVAPAALAEDGREAEAVPADSVADVHAEEVPAEDEHMVSF